MNWALSTILRSEIETIGAGRTDTGVHASTMVAHFDFLEIENLQNLSAKLCRILPPDISVKEIRKVSETANARFDAISRTYHYHVYTQKNPFLRHYAVQLHFIPDFKLMNEAAAMLLTVDDFTSFSKLGTDVKTNICHVTRAHWVQVDDNLWRFEITATAFCVIWFVPLWAPFWMLADIKSRSANSKKSSVGKTVVQQGSLSLAKLFRL